MGCVHDTGPFSRAVLTLVSESCAQVLTAGDYFGEEALLKETPRSTSVVAGSGAAVTCLILDRVAFEEVVGDLDVRTKHTNGSGLSLLAPRIAQALIVICIAACLFPMLRL